jgi:hypothetical protein
MGLGCYVGYERKLYKLVKILPNENSAVTFRINTYIFLFFLSITLDHRMGSRAVSDILPRYSRFTTKNTADVTVSPSPSDYSLSQLGMLLILAAFYDIHGRKREVLFFCSVPDIGFVINNNNKVPHSHQLSSPN